MAKKTYKLKDGSFEGTVNTYLPEKNEVSLIDKHFNVRTVKKEDVEGMEDYKPEVKDMTVGKITTK